MRVLRREAQHAVAAEAGDQPVDQIGHRLLLDGAAVETVLGRVERLAERHGELDRIEAEAGIERIGQRLDALAIEPEQRLGIARGAAGLDGETAHRAIAAEEAEFEDAPALATRFQHTRRLPDQSDDNAFEACGIGEGLGEMALDHAIGRRAQRRDAAILVAEDAPELDCQGLAEAGGEGFGRPLCEMIERLEAGAGERDHGLGVGIERSGRQRA